MACAIRRSSSMASLARSSSPLTASPTHLDRCLHHLLHQLVPFQRSRAHTDAPAPPLCPCAPSSAANNGIRGLLLITGCPRGSSLAPGRDRRRFSHRHRLAARGARRFSFGRLRWFLLHRACAFVDRRRLGRHRRGRPGALGSTGHDGGLLGAAAIARTARQAAAPAARLGCRENEASHTNDQLQQTSLMTIRQDDPRGSTACNTGANCSSCQQLEVYVASHISLSF
jgi:hypothetical protein